MRAELLKLADRCEAVGPSHTLDSAIYKVVRAEVYQRRLDQLLSGPMKGRLSPADYDGYIMPPAYTASLDAALTLVPEGLYPTIDFVKSRVWLRTADGFDLPSGCAYGYAATPALALCAAALRAIAEGV